MSTYLTPPAVPPFDQASDAKLFPLPATVFEEYMLLDDSTAFPMDIYRRLRFVGGRLELNAFRQAIEIAVARNPLFACRVEKRGKRFFWVPAPDAPTAFQAIRRDKFTESDAVNGANVPNVSNANETDVETIVADVRPICLTRETGLRTTVVWDERSADVVFQTHHAVADGAGIELLIRDILCEYAVLVKQTPNDFASLPPIDFDALRKRGHFGLTLKSYLLNSYYTTKSTFRFLFVNPRPVFEPIRRDVEKLKRVAVFQEFADAKNVSAPNVRRRDDLIATSLTVDETLSCLKTAKRFGATLNDLIVAAFSATLDRRRRLRGETIRGVDRIAIPMDMRAKNRKNSAACNVVTMAFLDLPARVRRDPIRLLRETNRRTTEIKRRDQKYFLDLVLKTGRFLGNLIGSDLSPFLKSNRRRATATVSNLGRTFLNVPLDRTTDGRIRIGALVVDSPIEFAPIRNESIVSIAASTYAGRLRFGLRYDLDYLTPKEAAEFLDDLRAACVYGFDAESANVRDVA